MHFLRALSTTAVVVGTMVFVAEIALIGYWITSGSTLIVIGVELLIIVSVCLIAVALRYRDIGRELHEATVADAAARERERIAAAMHDTLGHQLSLIALRAAALQMRTSESVATVAAEIRRDADEATAHLHDIIEMMRSEGAESITAVIERARRAGIDVRARGLDTVSDSSAQRHLYVVVQEGLTNAMRHAAGQQVDIDFIGTDDTTTVSITTALIAGVEGAVDRQPRGLTTLGERIRSAGGTLSVETTSSRFTLSASVPHGSREASDDVPRRRHPLLILLAQVSVPVAVALAVTVGFYATASRGSVMEQSVFRSISVGESEASVDRTVPRGQAHVRLIRTDSRPTGWRCRYYTDGNFPLAIATYEICFHDGFVTRTTDLRSRPWT